MTGIIAHTQEAMPTATARPDGHGKSAGPLASSPDDSPCNLPELPVALGGPERWRVAFPDPVTCGPAI